MSKHQMVNKNLNEFITDIRLPLSIKISNAHRYHT